MFVREKLNVLCNILRQKNYYKFKFIHLIRLKANIEGEASPPTLDETLSARG